ncbi:recombination protein RecR [Candidatus Gracilibacteria bacterium CG17_big_fil_post_rev_8_21_14_2_50_48_13]|nr:MAG: recombination protein RecR [Candidatus Gracilibacteria bacterium CG17_big_fil_post_rev_8_21_14_2_50_48_13]
MEFPKAADEAIEAFCRLPGIGRKTAQRLVQHLLKHDAFQAERFASSIADLHAKIHPCKQCYHITEKDRVLCAICDNPLRDKQQICVVEDFMDVFAIEQTRSFTGVYHVLYGTLSPISGIGPEKLKIAELFHRMLGMDGPIELIFATNPTLEGEATAMYIKEHMPAHIEVSFTRIAKGMPMGGDIDYADEITLGNALSARVHF